MAQVRLKKVLTAYAASGVLGMKAAHPEGSPVLLRGRLLWRPGARARRRGAVGRPGARSVDACLRPSRQSASAREGRPCGRFARGFGRQRRSGHPIPARVPLQQVAVL